MYHDEAMRAMVWSTHWSGGHRWWASRALSARCGWPVALVRALPVVLGVGVAAIVVLSVGLAVLATIAALAFCAALTVAIFGALGFVAWQVVRRTVPGLAG